MQPAIPYRTNTFYNAKSIATCSVLKKKKSKAALADPTA